MGYSSIAKKRCKCSIVCDKFPTIGYGGYNIYHAPDEMKEKIKLKAKDKLAVRKLNAQASNSFERVSNLDANVLKEKWFRLIRQSLVGTCQCGCGNKSQKRDDMFFRHSCCHIFPKSKFDSVKYHPLNYVERAFWGGCHSTMDDTSMDRWVGFADWDDIKAKFYVLVKLLTPQEKSSKFYSHLERLVFNN